MGTAPRSPDQDRNACSRHGSRNGRAAATTDTGRATSSTISPMTMPGSSAAGSSVGSTYSPSMTNRPIWASQPRPSANDSVEARCGSRELPRMTAAT